MVYAQGQPGPEGPSGPRGPPGQMVCTIDSLFLFLVCFDLFLVFRIYVVFSLLPFQALHWLNLFYICTHQAQVGIKYLHIVFCIDLLCCIVGDSVFINV